MYELKSDSNSELKIASNVIISQKTLTLIFQWDKELQLKNTSEKSLFTIGNRKHELWKTTCFECFIKESSNEKYIEINLSHFGEWNVYQFNAYRTPQPPNENLSWDLIQFKSEIGKIEATFSHDLITNFKNNDFQIGLTSILEFKNDSNKHFLALAHLGEKPDFHNSKTFIAESHIAE